jgi:hypothetical protein
MRSIYGLTKFRTFGLRILRRFLGALVGGLARKSRKFRKKQEGWPFSCFLIICNMLCDTFRNSATTVARQLTMTMTMPCGISGGEFPVL